MLYIIMLYLYYVLLLHIYPVFSTPFHGYNNWRGPRYSRVADIGELSNTSNVHITKKPFIEVRNATYHGSGPREEAKAMCSVRTQEVNATANATITRKLHGVVTSRELHNAIQRLEVIIFGQMQQLWQSLEALRTQTSAGTENNLDRWTSGFRRRSDAG